MIARLILRRCFGCVRGGSLEQVENARAGGNGGRVEEGYDVLGFVLPSVLVEKWLGLERGLGGGGGKGREVAGWCRVM